MAFGEETLDICLNETVLILMQPDLDANYEAVKADTWPWPHEA